MPVLRRDRTVSGNFCMNLVYLRRLLPGVLLFLGKVLQLSSYLLPVLLMTLPCYTCSSVGHIVTTTTSLFRVLCTPTIRFLVFYNNVVDVLLRKVRLLLYTNNVCIYNVLCTYTHILRVLINVTPRTV